MPNYQWKKAIVLSRNSTKTEIFAEVKNVLGTGESKIEGNKTRLI